MKMSFKKPFCIGKTTCLALAFISTAGPLLLAKVPESEPEAMVPAAEPAKNHVGAEKASDIMGMDVKNLQGEKLGTVDNLMVDLSSGRIVAVIVSSGGFIGLGDVLSAIPPSVLGQKAGQDYLSLDVTAKALAALPHFPNNAWPDLSQPDYVDGIYRAYNVPPYYVVTPTAAQTAREKRIALNAKDVETVSVDGKYTIHIKPMSEDSKREMDEFSAEIAKAKEENRRLELKLSEENAQ